MILTLALKIYFHLHLLSGGLSYLYHIYTLTMFLYRMLIQLSTSVLYLLVLTRIIMIHMYLDKCERYALAQVGY